MRLSSGLAVNIANNINEGRAAVCALGWKYWLTANFSVAQQRLKNAYIHHFQHLEVRLLCTSCPVDFMGALLGGWRCSSVVLRVQSVLTAATLFPAVGLRRCSRSETNYQQPSGRACYVMLSLVLHALFKVWNSFGIKMTPFLGLSLKKYFAVQEILIFFFLVIFSLLTSPSLSNPFFTVFILQVLSVTHQV